MLFLSHLAFAKTYKSSWSEFEPYSYIEKGKLVGIDIDLAKAVFGSLGNEIDFKEISWDASLKKLEKGEIDFLISATFTQERDKYAFFTSPYRQESLSIVLQRHPRIIINFNTPHGLVSSLKSKNFRMGTVNSYAYPEQVVNNYIHQTAHIKADTSSELVKAMYNKDIDGFITDTNEARKIVENSDGRLSEVSARMRTPIRFMLSKKSFTQEDVRKINSLIQQITRSKMYHNIMKKYYN